MSIPPDCTGLNLRDAHPADYQASQCNSQQPLGGFDFRGQLADIRIACGRTGLSLLCRYRANTTSERHCGSGSRPPAAPDLEAQAAQALGTFLAAPDGVSISGRSQGIIVIDDYAHHPTEIRATLAAARAAIPDAACGPSGSHTPILAPNRFWTISARPLRMPIRYW